MCALAGWTSHHDPSQQFPPSPKKNSKAVMMSIDELQFYHTMSTNKELVAVVDGIELDIMQEMASLGWLWQGKWALVLCWQRGKWCAMTSKSVQDRESWYKCATQRSEETARTIPFQILMCSTTVHVRFQGETETRTVHQRHTESVDTNIVRQWRS